MRADIKIILNKNREALKKFQDDILSKSNGFDGISWKRLGYISRYIVSVTVPASDPRGKRLRHRPRTPSSKH